MQTIQQRLQQYRERIRQAEARYARTPGSVRLLAVSKTRPAEDLRAAMQAGQNLFGESYLQEALSKIEALSGQSAQWHFIGPIQSNKTKNIARHFDWVHSIDRLKVAQRLSEQRPDHLDPLQVCLQVNASGEASKSGVDLDEVAALARAVVGLPRLRLRGLMTIPAATEDFEQQRLPYRALRETQAQLVAQGIDLDTLSMGMTADMEAAIAEGSTIVRIGTGLFGARTQL